MTTLAAGTQLGPYEILALIGAGGMGEVYRARDTRLGREVAVKILPGEFASDAARLRRFELEARAASALNHPNILTIFDIGADAQPPFVVSELLEGETLRERLGGGPLPLRKALDYGLQVAHGLAAAHDKGIVHRDLKPENIFITKDGRAKILDFGLAKVITPQPISGAPAGQSDSKTEAPTLTRAETGPGVVLGTISYLSPEQLRGKQIDHRADIFAFGSILFEMLTGQRAFKRESDVETMHAILKEDPLESSGAGRRLPAPLERVVRHCLEKNPEERFRSAHDLAFDLSMLTGLSGLTATSMVLGLRARRLSRPIWKWLGAAVVVGILALASYVIGSRMGGGTLPSFHQLTFNRGAIFNARFARQSDTIVYSASWSGDPVDVFSMRAETPESRPVGLPNTNLLSISSLGEMALQLNSRHIFHLVRRGTLARMPLAGGAPREVLEHVEAADWSPDGQSLAVVRWVDRRTRLEYPIGNVLYETDGYITNARVSPKGDSIAFFDHRVHGDDRGAVAVIDLAGNKRALTAEWSSGEGVAWSSSGDEVWFTASKGGEAFALYGVTLEGKQRMIMRAPVGVVVNDISGDGRVLLTTQTQSTPMIGLAPGETKERDLSWLDWVRLGDLSPDGRTLLFVHAGQGSGANYATYLRKTDGSPAMRLGEGEGKALSPDGKWALAVLYSPPQLTLLPTGAGQVRRLERHGIERYDGAGACWLPDGKRVCFVGTALDQTVRYYVQDIDGGPPRPITPDGVKGRLVSPDGRLVVAEDSDERKVLYSIDGGEPRAIPGLAREDSVARWSSDPGWVYVYRRNELPLKVFRLELATGRKQPLREVMPSDPAGITGTIRILLTPDAKGYVYAFARNLFQLHLVDGLK
jgi:Tol biopolymer transport system component